MPLSDPLTDQISAIHKAIRGLPGDLDFSDPTQLTMLPFPSPLAIPFQRFEWREQDNLCYFQYMGRSKFTDLYALTQGPNFRKGFEKIYLYGSSGSGKSHILAALACCLIWEGKRVVYVPDCSLLLADFAQTIRIALSCAFYDSQKHLKTIESARNVDALIDFCHKQTDIHFIVDQLNALELGGRNKNSDDTKRRVKESLGRMTLLQKYIFSASANEQSNQVADQKQSGITVVRINGGMNQVCRNCNAPGIILTSFRRKRISGLFIMPQTFRHYQTKNVSSSVILLGAFRFCFVLFSTASSSTNPTS